MSHRDFNIAYYRPEDWARLLSIIDDRESFHETWEERHAAYLDTKKNLQSMGLVVHPLVVDLDELVRFCFQRGLKNDGPARSTFVSGANQSA